MSTDNSDSSHSAVSSNRVPQLSGNNGGGNGSGYAVWRPLMETFLMRAGIETSDYKEEISQWLELERCVQQDRRANEKAAMAKLLAASSIDSSSSSSAAKGVSLSADQLQAKQLVAEMMKRARRAYGLLYAALPDELRLLVKEVPQGYAFGIWSFLEKRFQNTEQDNVADLWERFTALEQSGEESFEDYKARVDEVKALLVHAKQGPPDGLYTHRLLWKLQPRYDQAVLALKASGKITDAEKIDWVEIASFLFNHERSQSRLNGSSSELTGERSMAARRGNKVFKLSGSSSSTASHTQGGAGTGITCYGCGEVGHMKRECPKRMKKKNNYRGSGEDHKVHHERVRGNRIDSSDESDQEN